MYVSYNANPEEKRVGDCTVVWGAYLKKHGFVREVIPNTCPDCYTVADFCREHPKGTFILALSGHVVAVIDGKYFDTWDSGEELPIYYWHRKED